MTANRPRGRRPGRDDTRGTIREAAARLFERDGYDRVSLRAIAREADVDPALVHHYFRSKCELYTQAAFDTTWDLDSFVRDTVRGEPEQVGRRVARGFFDLWDTEPDRHREYLSTLEEGQARGRHALTEMLARELFTPVAASFGHPNAVYRGQLAASALLGVMVARHRLQIPLIAQVSLRSLATPLSASLQHYLVEAW